MLRPKSETCRICRASVNMSGNSRSLSIHASSYFFSAQCAAALSTTPIVLPRIVTHGGMAAWNIENAIDTSPFLLRMIPAQSVWAQQRPQHVLDAGDQDLHADAQQQE